MRRTATTSNASTSSSKHRSGTSFQQIRMTNCNAMQVDHSLSSTSGSDSTSKSSRTPESGTGTNNSASTSRAAPSSPMRAIVRFYRATNSKATYNVSFTQTSQRSAIMLGEGISLGYSGNPYGPAGTSKTESAKALGQKLGRQPLVLNCDETIIVQEYAVISQVSLWAARVVASMSSTVSTKKFFLLSNSRFESYKQLGRNITVNPNSSISVILNPAGKGCGGRSKLPYNFTELFRAVVMTKRDNKLIQKSSCTHSRSFLFSQTARNCSQTRSTTIGVYIR